MHVQWNPSNPDTMGTHIACLEYWSNDDKSMQLQNGQFTDCGLFSIAYAYVILSAAADNAERLSVSVLF